MYNRYTFYAGLKDGRRYIFKADDLFYEVIKDYLNGKVDAEKFLQLNIHELYSLSEINNCKYVLVENKNSKIVERLDVSYFVNQR